MKEVKGYCYILIIVFAIIFNALLCTWSKEEKNNYMECEVERMTNADKIRNMTDVELATFLSNIEEEAKSGFVWDYENICLKWLQSEVKENDEKWK